MANLNKIFYAIKYLSRDRKPFFSNFYDNYQVIFMCFEKTAEVYKVKVREVKPGEVSRYWGWHQFKLDEPYKGFQEEEYCMIWPSSIQTEMCFAYGFLAEEKMGRGRLVNLVVEEVEKVIRG